MQGGPLLALTVPDAPLQNENDEEAAFSKPPADGGVATVLYVVRRQLRLLHRTEEGGEALQLTTQLPGGGVADGAWHHFIVRCVMMVLRPPGLSSLQVSHRFGPIPGLRRAGGEPLARETGFQN